MPEDRQKSGNPFARPTYRVLNEPFKILGILDWRYAFAAAVPAAFIGLFAHSKLVAIAAFVLLAWQAYRIAEDDPNLPLVLWLTLFDKKHAGGFSHKRREQ
jgi:hypothetical protein